MMGDNHELPGWLNEIVCIAWFGTKIYIVAHLIMVLF